MPNEPIKDKKTVKKILEVLSTRRNGFRDALLFEFLLSTGLRISDGLSVRKKDINIKDGLLRICTSKNGEDRIIALNTKLLHKLDVYSSNMNKDDLLFPVQRQWVHKIVKWATDQVGLDSSRYSCHTTRKTAAYHFYHDSGRDLARTMHFLGHRSTKETMRYLGLKDEEVNERLVLMNWS